MSRIAKKPILVPDDVDINFKKNNIIVEGIHGKLKFLVNKFVKIKYKNKLLTFFGNKRYYKSWMYAGTCRSIIFSMIYGVRKKFFKTLILFGVGYKVALDKNIVILNLGYSHEIKYVLPNEINAICNSNTKITLNGISKQLVYQTAANIRLYRVPEPYKGKGIRYENENIFRKEAKKK